MENELSRVVDALPGLVWTARLDGSIDFLNQRWREYTGLSGEGILGVEEEHGRGWQGAIHPEDLPWRVGRWRYIPAPGGRRGIGARPRRLEGGDRSIPFPTSGFA